MQGQRLEGVLLEKPEQASLFEQPTRELVLACEDNLSFMERLPDGQMKLVVTSPPYNLGKDYEDKTSLDAYIESQERVISECVRVLHPQGSICWQVGNYVENGEIVPLDAILYPVFRALGLKLRNRIVWHFGHGLHCTRRLSGRYETINWWTKSDDYTWNLAPFESRPSTPANATSRVRTSESCRGTQRGRTRATYGSFRTSRATTRRRPSTPASSPWNWWNVSSSP